MNSLNHDYSSDINATDTTVIIINILLCINQLDIS